MADILQKGGYENGATWSGCELIVKLLSPLTRESTQKRLTICAFEAGFGRIKRHGRVTLGSFRASQNRVKPLLLDRSSCSPGHASRAGRQG